MQNCFVHTNAPRQLAEALVFAHGEKAWAEAKRNQELNELNGNQKLAAEWARALELVAARSLQRAA